MRFVLLLPLLLSWALVPVVAAAGGERGAAPRADLVAALEVLRQWDTRRERAWAAADERAVGSLYVRGSPPREADLRLLRAYAARGVVVRRLVTQVFAVTVLRRDRSVLRLRVFDRVAGGELLRQGRTAPLRSSPPKTRDVELRRVAGRWRVAAISPVSGSERAPRGARR